MSSYTNVIFACSISDVIRGKVSELNEILNAYELSPLVCIGLLDTVWIESYNYIPLYKIVEAINSIKWLLPEEVQLLVKDEHSDKYSDCELAPRTLDSDNGIWKTITNEGRNTVSIAKDLFGAVDETTVRAIVTSKISPGAFEKFMLSLNGSEMERINALLKEAFVKYDPSKAA